MKVFVSLLLLFEIAYFVGVILYSATPSSDSWPTNYLQAIKWVLSVAYGLNILAFIPLFIVVMGLLNRQFTSLFLEIRVKVFLIFTAFLAVIIFRYLCYICLQFEYISFLKVEHVQSLFPFYISEILIALHFALQEVEISLHQQMNQAAHGVVPMADLTYTPHPTVRC